LKAIQLEREFKKNNRMSINFERTKAESIYKELEFTIEKAKIIGEKEHKRHEDLAASIRLLDETQTSYSKELKKWYKGVNMKK
jgi:hypothetical protein